MAKGMIRRGIAYARARYGRPPIVSLPYFESYPGEVERINADLAGVFTSYGSGAEPGTAAWIEWAKRAGLANFFGDSGLSRLMRLI